LRPAAPHLGGAPRGRFSHEPSHDALSTPQAGVNAAYFAANYTFVMIGMQLLTM